MTCIEERLVQEEKIVPLKDLRLDPKNVRFRHMASLLTEKQMEQWLFEEEDVKALIKQILRDRRLQHPIYVQEDGQDHYIVKEGNRRTVALRKIKTQILMGKIKGFEKEHFDLVPVTILKGSEHSIKVFVGQTHVSGPKPWDAVNKASQVYELNEIGDSIEEIAEEFGLTKGKVKNYYDAFKATETYGKRYPDDKNYVPKFSYFMEFFQSKVLKNWAKEDPTSLDYFIDLVGKKKLLVTYKGVRQLAKIIAAPNPKRARSLAVLDTEDGNIEKAWEIFSESGNPAKGFWKNLENMRKLVCQAKFEDFREAIDDQAIQQSLEETITTLTEMKSYIEEISKGGKDEGTTSV